MFVTTNMIVSVIKMSPNLSNSESHRPSAHTRQASRASLTCPFSRCTFRIPTNTPVEARSHFDQYHKNCTFPSLTNNFLNKTKLFLCTETSCDTPKQCFHTQNAYTRHYNHSHKLQHRDQLNSNIIQRLFSPNAFDLEQWRHSLEWLYTLKQEPPAQRTNHCAHLRRSQQALYHSTLDKVIQLILETSIPYVQETDHPPAYETSSVPFWNILFIFNHLLMHKNHLPTQSIATLLPIRIAMLNQGRLRELFDEAFAFPESTLWTCNP
jgi:hypothetical protein